MSLTTLLSAGRGPVWEWFDTSFPETRSVCAVANRELRGGPAKRACLISPVRGTDHALVGTAVGYLLSAHLRADALDRTMATAGAHLLNRSLHGLATKPSRIERLVVARVSALSPSDTRLSGEAWTELCLLTVILARFEQYFRARAAVLAFLAGPLRDAGHDLAALARALAAEPSLHDLDALGRATIEDQVHIRRAVELHVGPVFAQSGALGGADADLIYDGVLVDLKSTASAQVAGRNEVWQLLGYLFADTDDRYHVRRVSIAALRRRRAVFWPAQELVDALAGGSVASVDDWRQEFAALLAPLALRRERPRDAMLPPTGEAIEVPAVDGTGANGTGSRRSA